MKFAYIIARRFMLGGKGAGPSRLTGWISIIGLTAGAFALIVSLSVLNGFEERVTNRVMGFEGDLRISSQDDDVNLMEILDRLLRDSNVLDAIPFRERKGLVTSSLNEQRLVTLKAIPESQFSSFYDIKIDLANDVEGSPVFIGHLLAQRLVLDLGDQVKIMSPLDHSGVGLPRRFSGSVAGVFQAEVLDVDDRVMFIPLELGERIFLRNNDIDGIDVRLKDPQKAEELKKHFRRSLPGGLSIKSWADLHSGLFNAMRMERLGTIAVLSLIVLVACFNLMSTLVLVTYQKIREIGILRTLGTTARNIQRIILIQGLMIGSVGAFIGIIFSVILVFVQNQFGLFPLPEEVYFIDRLPMVFKSRDLFAVIGISFILILISSVIASSRTLKIDPKEAVYLEK